MKNYAMKMCSVKRLERTELEMPVAAADQVVVKIEYCGICGSDMHFFQNGAIGTRKAPPDFILGHESAGTVIEVGKDVTTLKVGDRVALEPGVPCGKCQYCKSGKYNLCPDVHFLAAAKPPTNGALRNYFAYPAEWCFKLPDNVSTLEGALIEPLAVGFHAAIQGDAHLGQKAVVMGAGCIGLVSMMALKARGVSEVYVVDIMEKRLDKAMELGATGVINGAKEDVVAKVKELTGGMGADLVVETAGTQITTVQAIHMAKKGSNIVLVGYSKSGEMTLPMSLVLDKELTFKTVFRYRHIYPLAIDAVASGKVNLKGIVTDIFSLDEAQKAIIDKVKDGKMVELSTDAFAGMDIKRRDIRTFKKDETTKDESIFEVGSVIAFKTPHKGDKIGIMRILSIGVDFTQDSAWNNENATITFDLYYQK